MKPKPISPAQILKAIRDKTAVTETELMSYLRHGRWFVPESMIRREVTSILQSLISGQLVNHDADGVYEVTAATNLITSALHISLTELSELDGSAVIAHPFFEKPTDARSSRVSEIFVAMPFTSMLQPVYDDHIQKVCKQLSLSVARADDFYTSTSIMADTWKAIFFCKVLVADCTGRNPNVFYEVGISHTLGRPTILLSQNIDDVPFDIRHLRVILYQFTPRGMRDFEADFARVLAAEIANAIPSGQ